MDRSTSTSTPSNTVKMLSTVWAKAPLSSLELSGEWLGPAAKMCKYVCENSDICVREV